MRKTTKRIFSAVLAFVLALSVLTIVPSAAEASIAVSVDKSSCMQGDTIVATVYFPSTVSSVAALDMSLKYDKSKLEFVSLEKGSGLNSALKAQVNGKVYSENAKIPGEINWVVAGTNNFVFSGTFAIITFKVRDTALNGNTTLDLVVTNAANSGYVDVMSSFTAADAVVEVVRNSVNDFVFERLEDGSGYVITAYHCATVAQLDIPSQYKQLPVVGIEDDVFYNHSELTDVTLPEQLEFIGDNAFQSCRNLTGIDIPDTVTSIGSGAFSGCTSLEALKLPLGITEIKENTFTSCYFLEEVEIPFTVTYIGDAAFYNCLSLGAVKLSKNATFGNGAFEKCSSAGIEFTTVEGNTYLPTVIEESYPDSTIKIVEDLSLGTAECEESFEYTGVSVTPDVTVELENGVKVTENTDYKVVYVKNVKPGKAKVYVVGIAGYGEGYVLEFDVVCDHNDIRRVIVQKQTCTLDAVYRCKCMTCGYIYDEVIPATGHPSGEWVYDKYPSYAKPGVKHKKCTVCGEDYELNTIADKVFPDVDLNGKINSTDALMLLQHTVGMDVYITPQGLFNADANGNGTINSTDALIILKIAVGQIKL
ncbi:MAG: leucine-rich repeat protein [Clostridia bacterium]|nr:leucine-rich repeat protein [Clostridia bacterium]